VPPEDWAELRRRSLMRKPNEDHWRETIVSDIESKLNAPVS
jgi:hypothetical protein